jgi:hypothetical protein
MKKDWKYGARTKITSCVGVVDFGRFVRLVLLNLRTRTLLRNVNN